MKTFIFLIALIFCSSHTLVAQGKDIPKENSSNAKQKTKTKNKNKKPKITQLKNEITKLMSEKEKLVSDTASFKAQIRSKDETINALKTSLEFLKDGTKNVSTTTVTENTENCKAKIEEKDKLIAILRDTLNNYKEILSIKDYDINNYESDISKLKKQHLVKDLQNKILYNSFEAELSNKVNQLISREDYVNAKVTAEKMIMDLNELKKDFEPKNLLEKHIGNLNLYIKLSNIMIEKDQFLKAEFNENNYTKLLSDIRQVQSLDNSKMNTAQKSLITNTLQLLTKYCSKYNELVLIFKESDDFHPNSSRAQEVLKDKLNDPELEPYLFLKTKLRSKYNNPLNEKSIKQVNCN
jgi:hypothetical protein